MVANRLGNGKEFAREQRFTEPRDSRRSGEEKSGISKLGWVMRFAVAAGLAQSLSGCISINVPDKPIVIELNVNIKQEVVYRLAEDTKTTVKDNADVF